MFWISRKNNIWICPSISIQFKDWMHLYIQEFLQRFILMLFYKYWIQHGIVGSQGDMFIQHWYTCTCIRQFVGYFKTVNGSFEILSPILRDLKYTQKYMRFDICIEIINKLETRCLIWTIGEWPIYE